MIRRVQESRSRCNILAVLFALVIAIRIAIPTGFMPTTAPDGIVISVCTGIGETKAFLPTGKDDGQDRHSPAEGPCTFAASLGGADIPSPAAAAVPVIAPVSNAFASRAIADLTVHRLAAPPPPALGPPARA